MNVETPVLQSVMTAAYDRWKDDRATSHAQFLSQLSAKEAFVVRLGNLNYQVENGGFYQWCGNGYATKDTINELRTPLIDLVDFAKADEACDGEAVAKAVSPFERAAKAIREHGYQSPSEILEEDDEELGIVLSELDRPYYAVNDAFMLAAERYLIATYV